MPNDILIPAIPQPPDDARSLILEAGENRRILFDLAGRMPTDEQWSRMARRIARDVDSEEPLSWRWTR